MLKISNEEISNQQDFYAHHLGEIDKVNPVVSTEDIRTINNIPLVISGARITCKTAKRILEHKLLKPLEQQTQLNKTICGESLLKEFYALFQKYPDIKQTHEKTGYKLKFEKIVRSFILSPLVTQKLTVFHHCLPNEFEKTLFCTWLAVNISFSIKQDDHDVTVTYLAAITHDLGLLHISPQIFSKPGKLSPEELRALQSHIATGKLFLNGLGGLYKIAANAVLEHHECCDGTGYPRGLSGDKLGGIGQIIAMADSLQAIRVNQLEKVGRSIYDTIPFLRLNQTSHTELVYRGAISVIKCSGLKSIPINPFDTIDELVKHLIIRGETLDDAMFVLIVLLYLSSELKLGVYGKKMTRVVKPVEKMIRQSGLTQDEIMKWLVNLELSNHESALNELCEIELMQNELFWQLKKARNAYVEFLDKEPKVGSPAVMTHLRRLAEYIESII